MPWKYQKVLVQNLKKHKKHYTANIYSFGMRIGNKPRSQQLLRIFISCDKYLHG